MCASWLHHGDHSLALLSWFAATPVKKKNLNLGCLPPFTLVCALLAAPYRNAALHHCEPGMVLPSGVRLLAACVTVFGLVLGVSFRLRPFGFLRFSSPFPILVMSVSARCCALLAAPGKWSLTLQLWKGCLALCCTKCISPAAWCCALLAAPKTGGP